MFAFLLFKFALFRQDPKQKNFKFLNMNKINNIFSNAPSSYQKNFSFSQGKKRFLKKQVLLETILFQYMEWRELIKPKISLKQTSDFYGGLAVPAFSQSSKSRILKDFQTNGIVKTGEIKVNFLSLEKTEMQICTPI